MGRPNITLTARRKVPSHLAFISLVIAVMVLVWFSLIVFVPEGLPPSVATGGPALVVVGLGVVGALLAVFVLVRCLFRRSRSGLALSVFALLASAASALLAVSVLNRMRESTIFAVQKSNLKKVLSAAMTYATEAGRAPANMEDLNLGEEVKGCVLAPLDRHLFDVFFVEEWPYESAFLAAYSPVPGREQEAIRMYVTLKGDVGTMSVRDLESWAEMQSEALGWLAEEFPAKQLREVLKRGDTRRRRAAVEIFLYKCLQQKD